MITYKAGKVVGNLVTYMPKEMLSESVIGQVYELQMKTNGGPNPANTAAALSQGLKEKFGATLLYFKIEDDTITMQIEGSPFAWAPVLVWLPEILVILGVMVGFIMVFLVTSSIPSWQYSVGAVALMLIFMGPKIISKIAMMKVNK